MTSVAHTVFVRLGIDAAAIFCADEYDSISLFNSPDTIAQLGAATSDISEMVLRQIERSVRSMERQERDTLAKSQQVLQNEDRKTKGALNMELSYRQNGDYLIPDLKIEVPEQPLGKYGRMRQKYLKEHRPILWNQMILEETLFPHLLEIEQAAQSRLEQMMPELAAEAGATEALKASDP